MHYGHDYGHDHGQADGGSSGGGSSDRGLVLGRARIGDNRNAAQWQTPHLAEGAAPPPPEAGDLDLVAAAFVEGFLACGDPTSFLRLAHVPFEATDGDGRRLALLRVEIDAVVDVGAIAPHLGGESFHYDPLPSRMASRRKRLRFVYFDGCGLRSFDLAEALKLAAA
jgi:hypothetical protein